jgi:hypothetical protein
VIKIRSTVKGRLGHRSEALVRYRIRPMRARDRAKQEEIGVAVFPRPDLRPLAASKSRKKSAARTEAPESSAKP